MRRAAAALCLVVYAALGGCKPAPAALTAADRTAAHAMDSAWSAGVAAGDMSAMMAGYASDAIVQPPSMPAMRGTDAIRQFYQAMTSVKVTIALAQETADGAGDFMYTTGRYHYQQMPAGPSEDGKYLEVFRRGADGKWTLVAESWSPNAPAAPAPAAKPAAPPARAK